MKHLTFLVLALLLIVGCQDNRKSIQREPWMNQPVSEWPQFALTNTIQFADTTFHDLANAMLIQTEHDTLVATCKHIFMVFENNGLANKIQLGNDFQEWSVYPKGQPNKSLVLGGLLNEDENENIGQFNTLKVRDWIIFEVAKTKGLQPLKIRSRALKEGETVYSVGWAMDQETQVPALIKMKVFKNFGKFCYVQTLTEDVNPEGRSGSPVIDTNGHLAGLVSGAEGRMGVIATTQYLKELLGQYQF
jgi:uncharacterized protein YcfL